MILERLYLENFKQFRDPLELHPPEGAVGVVGTNGSGKTTIFEAILWAFFGSKGGGPRFANDSIPWSGGSTAERSVVEVTMNIAGSSYTVFRSLHKGKTDARVLDESGRETIGGATEVAGWVQEHLLSMDRTAFEATFFARQKELEFFSGVEGVKRQREIARILDIDQVEKAQKFLRTDRNALKSEADGIEQLLSDTDHEALATDLADKKKQRASLDEDLEKLREEFEKSGERLTKSRAENERLEEIYRAHNRLAGELGAAKSSRERAAERASELVEKLRGLDHDEEKVRELEPRAKGLAEVSSEIEILEEARRREERKTAAQAELKRHHREAYEASGEASDMIEDLEPDGEELLPDWPESLVSEEEIGHAREVAHVLDGSADDALRLAEDGHHILGETEKKHESLAKLETRLEKGEKEIGSAGREISRLDREMSELSGGESLDERISALRKRQTELQRESAGKKGHADADEREAKNMEKARRMVEDSDEYAECPTCRRGFHEDEHAEVIQSLRERENDLRDRASATREECRKLDEEVAGFSVRIEESESLKSEFHELREKRSAAASRRENMQGVFDEILSDADFLREELDGKPAPSAEEMKESSRKVERLRKLRDARPRLASLVSAYDRACAAADEKKKEVESLASGPAYDAERYRQLVEHRSEIQTIIGRIETLGSRLEERPSTEERLAKARNEEKEAASETARLEKEISVLAFDEEKHFAARREVAEAEKSREESRERRDEAERELRRVANEVERLEAESRRYEEQRKAADEKGLRAASLSEMDGLFSEFYRELTARVRPNLQREASALIKILTDGRYERMEFDENYGVRLYDGLSDAYEISRFSGGEADIVSLCARVALSKMISARGSGALGFIVLDEVFGALDSGRRQNVLLALDRLKKAFGQIFIISHVSDVQESALLDETWFVEEDEEGKSSVRRVKQELGAPVEISS